MAENHRIQLFTKRKTCHSNFIQSPPTELNVFTKYIKPHYLISIKYNPIYLINVTSCHTPLYMLYVSILPDALHIK